MPKWFYKLKYFIITSPLFKKKIGTKPIKLEIRIHIDQDLGQ